MSGFVEGLRCGPSLHGNSRRESHTFATSFSSLTLVIGFGPGRSDRLRHDLLSSPVQPQERVGLG